MTRIENLRRRIEEEGQLYIPGYVGEHVRNCINDLEWGLPPLLFLLELPRNKVDSAEKSRKWDRDRCVFRKITFMRVNFLKRTNLSSLNKQKADY